MPVPAAVPVTLTAAERKVLGQRGKRPLPGLPPHILAYLWLVVLRSW